MNNNKDQKNNKQDISSKAPQAGTQPFIQSKPILADSVDSQIKEETEGINLIPSLTKEEEFHVKTKNTLSIGSLLAIIVLVLVSICVVAFNIITKNQLTAKQKELQNIENVVNQKTDKIIANNIILNRINLYKNVKANSFSYKEVITFLRDMAGKVQGISYDTIEMSESLSFKISGNAPNLEQLARLWYLFGVNENIESIKLKSFSKTFTGASFSFDGKLVLDNFKTE